ncbi:hypothetical protein OpiT1DRAFT_05538 [Opitutaceae bacterium TAV1]|nr:hypothetical protein OpiT1DRAFT_05538 [Opitutaceae bacterium TAV1]
MGWKPMPRQPVTFCVVHGLEARATVGLRTISS